jgi:hypothetical protein
MLFPNLSNRGNRYSISDCFGISKSATVLLWNLRFSDVPNVLTVTLLVYLLRFLCLFTRLSTVLLERSTWCKQKLDAMMI